jgi:hypothetical protein
MSQQEIDRNLAQNVQQQSEDNVQSAVVPCSL